MFLRNKTSIKQQIEEYEFWKRKFDFNQLKDQLSLEVYYEDEDSDGNMSDTNEEVYTRKI